MNDTNLLELAGFRPKSLQSPNAWVGHLPFAAWLLQELRPTVFVELGTHTGNSYFSVCQTVADKGLSTKCFAVDTWQGDEHAGRYNDDVFAGVRKHNEENYATFSRLLRTTFDEALSCFSDRSIELLHIDGMHTYDAVRHDFETWLPKLAPGAVVLFHDTNVRERNFGVWRLWEELQVRYRNNMEFVHSHGLGVLQLEGGGKSLSWLHDSTEKQRLVAYFSALGAQQLERYEREHIIAALQEEIIEQDKQARAQIRERDEQIANLIASASWKITKPLRFIGRLLRRERGGQR